MNVSICVFGCENTKSEIHDSLEIYLQTKNEDKVFIKPFIKTTFLYHLTIINHNVKKVTIT